MKSYNVMKTKPKTDEHEKNPKNNSHGVGEISPAGEEKMGLLCRRETRDAR